MQASSSNHTDGAHSVDGRPGQMYFDTDVFAIRGKFWNFIMTSDSFKMRYTTIKPSPGLSKFVRFFWTLESEEPYVHRSMADVSGEMIFHYHGRFEELIDDTTQSASLTAMHGPSIRIRRFRIQHSFGMFGVYLYPYSIPLLFGESATELYNRMPNLVELLGNEGRILEERMMVAASNEQRIEIMTGFFEQRIRKHSRHEHPVLGAIQSVIHSNGCGSIEKLSGQYYISSRQFERKFKEYSGVTPKLFSRIVRFHHACKYFGNDRKSLTDIAHESGYYDQSHFIHEFKEFSGLHPRQFFSGIAEGSE